jgi:hypothetical protein
MFPDERQQAPRIPVRGVIKRMMVLTPPDHGKSVYCLVRFPASSRT